MDRPPPSVSQPLPSNRKGEEAKERSLGQWWGMYWSTRLGGKSFYTEPALTFKWSHFPEVGPRPEVSGRRFSSDSVGRCRDWTTMVTTGKPGERSLADVWHNIEKKKNWSSVYRLESHRFIASFGGKKKKIKGYSKLGFHGKIVCGGYTEWVGGGAVFFEVPSVPMSSLTHSQVLSILNPCRCFSYSGGRFLNVPFATKWSFHTGSPGSCWLWICNPWICT